MPFEARVPKLTKEERDKRTKLRKQYSEQLKPASEEAEKVQDWLDKFDFGRVRKDRKDPSRLP